MGKVNLICKKHDQLHWYGCSQCKEEKELKELAHKLIPYLKEESL